MTVTSTRGAPEDREREEAWRRGQVQESDKAANEQPLRSAWTGQAPPDIAARAFAALAENVRDYAIFLMDPHGVITFWGEGARLIKWWTKAQAEGAHLRFLYPPGGSDDGTAEAHLREAAERGEYTGEGHRVRSDGSTFWAGVTLTALWDEQGTLLGFAKVTRDLTARRAADALLEAAAAASERARADAVAASAAKSGFLASMSHEIRTPVNAILGYLELLDLEIDGPLTNAQRRHLVRANASARHLLELITEVLDFSRIEADRVAIVRNAFRIGDAVSGALELVGPQARARGLHISDAMGGYAAGIAAWGDEVRVRQILTNLLANAIKFTSPRNGEPGRITISAGMAIQASPDAQLDGPGPWAYVRVEDTGVGIPAERLQPIFEAFVQADMALTRPHGGAGLGLAISRRLARLMGGDVTVRSHLGVGSTFFLWLPAAPVESLQTGGVPGHGPTGESRAGDFAEEPTDETDDAESGSGEGTSRSDRGRALPSVRQGGPLRAASDALLGELERVLHAYVARLRSDPETPTAHGASEAEIEDHLASFLADLAGALAHLDGALSDLDNPMEADTVVGVRDSTAIQRVVSERHGAQRARLGWSEAEVRREFVILREELTAAIRRAAPRHMPGPTAEAREREAERALEMFTAFVKVAEGLSLASFQRSPPNASVLSERRG